MSTSYSATIFSGLSLRRLQRPHASPRSPLAGCERRSARFQRAFDERSTSAICARSRRGRSWSSSDTSRRSAWCAVRGTPRAAAQSGRPTAFGVVQRPQRADRGAAPAAKGRCASVRYRRHAVAFVEIRSSTCGTLGRSGGSAAPARRRQRLVADFRIGPDDALHDRRRGEPDGARDLLVVSPPTSRKVSTMRASSASAGWQQVKMSRSSSSLISGGSSSSASGCWSSASSRSEASRRVCVAIGRSF